MKSLLALTLLCACNSKPQEPELTLSGCPTKNRLGYESLTAALKEEVASLEVSGAAIAVVQNGEIVYCQAVGVAGPESTKKVNNTTLFRIGAQTQQLTAALVGQQIDAGLLRTDSTIGEAYPNTTWSMDDRASAITIHQMMSHTSGMFDYVALDTPTGKDALSSFATEFAPAFLYLNTDPGFVWNYSNVGYSMTAAISEQADPQHRPWRHMITEDLLAPLQLNRTFFTKDAVLKDGDYSFGDGSIYPGYENVGPKAYDSGSGKPAEYAWSNVEDLSRWSMVLLKGSHPSLSSAAVERLVTPTVDTYINQGRTHYGWGMKIEQGFYAQHKWYSNLRWSESGDLPGYSSDMYVLPEQDAAVIVLSNRSYSHLDDTADEAIHLLVGEPDPADEPDYSFDEQAQLQSLIGEYEEKWYTKGFTITDEQGVPTINFPFLDENDISYEAKMDFYEPNIILATLQDAYFPLTIIRDESGAVTHLVCRQFAGEKLPQENAKRSTQVSSTASKEEITAQLKSALYPTIEEAIAALPPLGGQ